MKHNTKKSSITLPLSELKLVSELKKQLKVKSNVEVIRRGLYLLKERTHRDNLRAEYAKASKTTKAQILTETSSELNDHLSNYSKGRQR